MVGKDWERGSQKGARTTKNLKIFKWVQTNRVNKLLIMGQIQSIVVPGLKCQE